MDAYGYALTVGEPRCEEHHSRGPKGFQLTWTCAAPVIGEQQLDPSASGPLRRQEHRAAFVKEQLRIMLTHGLTYGKPPFL